MEWNLEEEIELIREKMMNAAAKKGLTDNETMSFSRKLDNLMNQYEELKKVDS
ncbi:MAG TPA: aspartyl-phosphate phosphatase Spo0E family protein [Sporosarcina psychrophila]|uniref:Aspartyl-phosphate phosphatase Spo0E family protein n=1 Tax=Sporosarcina psychrophila TaxID=1476 RepID=A0A921G172_SPOPS|nr:aspartyl-phosphate phosphatase Spo0E family protein [Sporosarcina psychrophila]